MAPWLLPDTQKCTGTQENTPTGEHLKMHSDLVLFSIGHPHSFDIAQVDSGKVEASIFPVGRYFGYDGNGILCKIKIFGHTSESSLTPDDTFHL